MLNENIRLIDFIEALHSGKEFREYGNQNEVKVKWKLENNILKRFPPNGNYWYNDGGEFLASLYYKKFTLVEENNFLS